MWPPAGQSAVADSGVPLYHIYKGEVRTAVAVSRRWYPAVVLRPVFLANKIKHNLLLSWHSHSAIVRGLCIVRQ